MDNKLLKNQAGFSLIELMIAMLIGLIVLNGVIQLVINSKRSYLDNQAISQIQENARFSVEILSRELKMAGYVGCMPVASGDINVSALVGEEDGLLIDSAGGFSAIEVFNDVTDENTGLPSQIKGQVQAGTDVLIVRHTDADHEWVLEKDLAASSGTVELNTKKQMAKGAPVALVSHDCSVANLMQVAEATETTDSKVKVTATVGSVQFNNFKKGSRVTPVVAYAYYIGDSSVISGVPALKRERLIVSTTGDINSRAEELAVGVSDMQLTVGTVGAGGVTFAAATGIADNASAVRMTLSMRSHRPVNPPTEDDSGHITKVAIATVRIRNQG